MMPWSLHKRRAEIQSLEKGSENFGTYPLPFRGSTQHLKVHKVSLDLPVYRLSNGRTIARQRDYIAKENKDTDFFKDPESVEALGAQHEILREMSKEQGLLTYFKQPANRQTEPIILDEDGYIINGNRRVCAWRMLVDEDPHRYQRYQYVLVAVIRNFSPDDINRLEALLQTQEDIKAEYSWITTALLFKTQHEVHKYDYKKLAAIHGKRKADVQEYIDMLEYADEYLTSRKKENQYSLVENHEYVFRAMRKQRKKFKDLERKEFFTNVIYQLLDNPDEAPPGRLYGSVKSVAENLPEIEKNVTEEFGIKPKAKKKGKQQDFSPLEPIIKSPGADSELSPQVLSVAKTPSDPGKFREVVRETIELGKKQKKETKSKDAFIKAIQKASTNLQDAITYYRNNKDSNTKGVDKFLQQIIATVEAVKDLVH